MSISFTISKSANRRTLDIVPLFSLLGRGVLPILRLKPFTLSLSLSALAGDTLLPGDHLVKEHVISGTVDHGTEPNGRFGSQEVFVRDEQMRVAGSSALICLSRLKMLGPRGLLPTQKKERYM
jgi:hypothetical protein